MSDIITVELTIGEAVLIHNIIEMTASNDYTRADIVNIKRKLSQLIDAAYAAGEYNE